MWSKRADIPPELRGRFELYGADVLAHAVGAGELSSKGPELDGLLRQNRGEIVKWLREKHDKAARRQTWRDIVQLIILAFAFISAIASVVILFRSPN